MEHTPTNTVLIVDDEAINLMVLQRILSPLYVCYTATGGTEAIDTAKAQLPDLILLDMMMPDLTGLEVMMQLKNDSLTAKIPVIFITSKTDTQDEETALTLGAADYIGKPFSPAVVRMRVHNQLEIINAMRHIHMLSITDELTGMSNRRHFNHTLSKAWIELQDQDTALSLILMDVDHFKRYNDTHGHLNGDLLLQGLATLLREQLASIEHVAARWGGEEFVILLPDTHLHEALHIADTLRQHISQHTFMTHEQQPTQTTVSMGVHTLTGDIPDGYTPQTFLSRVDELLYQAKALGRNRICTVNG